MQKAKLIKKTLPSDGSIYIFQAKQIVLPPYHYHNINQLLFVLDGKGKLNFENKTYKIQKYDMILLNKGDKHKFYPESAESMILYIIEYDEKIFTNEPINRNLLSFYKNLSLKDKIISTDIPSLIVINIKYRNIKYCLEQNY